MAETCVDLTCSPGRQKILPHPNVPLASLSALPRLDGGLAVLRRRGQFVGLRRPRRLENEETAGPVALGRTRREKPTSAGPGLPDGRDPRGLY